MSYYRVEVISDNKVIGFQDLDLTRVAEIEDFVIMRMNTTVLTDRSVGEISAAREYLEKELKKRVLIVLSNVPVEFLRVKESTPPLSPGVEERKDH